MLACSRAGKGGGANKQERLIRAATDYLGELYQLEEKIAETLLQISNCPLTPKQVVEVRKIADFHDFLIKDIFLISDRLLDGRKIPAGEKLFSLFEQHTEWVAKGKSRPNVELGRRLLIATDQYHLIHYYKVMTGGNESAEVLPLADYLLGALPAGELVSLSTDRGFSSIENRQLLELEIPEVIMLKKGKLSQADRERQRDKKWRKQADKHSAVESNINALEQHGLDRCPDRGEANFKRYVGLGVLAYNLHRIGAHLQEKERVRDRRQKTAA